MSAGHEVKMKVEQCATVILLICLNLFTKPNIFSYIHWVPSSVLANFNLKVSSIFFVSKLHTILSP